MFKRKLILFILSFLFTNLLFSLEDCRLTVKAGNNLKEIFKKKQLFSIKKYPAYFVIETKDPKLKAPERLQTELFSILGAEKKSDTTTLKLKPAPKCSLQEIIEVTPGDEIETLGIILAISEDTLVILKDEALYYIRNSEKADLKWNIWWKASFKIQPSSPGGTILYNGGAEPHNVPPPVNVQPPAHPTVEF